MPVDMTALEEWIPASLGSLTIRKLLTALLLLAACGGGAAGDDPGPAPGGQDVHRRAGAAVFSERGAHPAVYSDGADRGGQPWGVNVTSLVALVGVFGLAVSLAVQDVLSNVAGGLVILFSKPFALGDYIATGDGEGTVEEISLTHTKLDTFGGQRVMLPNSKLVDGKIVNYSVRGVRRVDHAVSASYDDSPQAVRTACLRAVERTKGVLPDPGAPGGSHRLWGQRRHLPGPLLDQGGGLLGRPCRLLEEIRRCFAEEGVTMTYNHLNVHILDKTKEK